MQFPHTLLVGIPTPTIWSVGNVLTHEGRTLILTLTVKEESDDASQIGKQYAQELLTWFDGEISFDETVNFFSHYVVPEECSIALVCIEEEKAVFYSQGEAAVSLLRAGSYLSIISTTTNTPQCVKGTLFAGDVLSVGTKAFFQAFESQISKVSDPVDAAQRVLATAQMQDMPDVAGCVFAFTPVSKPREEAKISEERELQTPVPVELPQTQRPTYPIRKQMPVWVSVSTSRRKLLKMLFAGLILLAMFLALQRFVIYRREARIREATAPLLSRYEQITTDQSLSRVDKERQLSDLSSDVQKALEGTRNDPAASSTLFTLKEKVQESYAQVSKQTSIEHLSIFYDFRLVTADFVASQVAYDVPGKLAVFLDTNRNRMVSLSLEKKQPQTLSLNSDLGSTQSLTIVDRKAYVLGTKGLYEVSLPLDTAGKTIVGAGSDWQTPKMIGSFADNLYVVDRQARQIFRYDRKDPGASPSAWLKRKEGIDFEGLNSLTIDGDVFLSTTQGKIYKLTRGEPSGFSFSDILTPPDSSLTVYTHPDSQYLYFLEPHAKRIVIANKSGAYVMSIVSPDLEAATGLIVDEEGKKIYILAGSLVYEVSFIIPS